MASSSEGYEIHRSIQGLGTVLILIIDYTSTYIVQTPKLTVAWICCNIHRNCLNVRSHEQHVTGAIEKCDYFLHFAMPVTRDWRDPEA